MIQHLNYLDAIRQGRDRVRESMKLLNELGLPSYPLLFLKMEEGDFTPVGEENLYTVLEEKERASIVLCDVDGNSKAITPPLSKEQAEKVARQLESMGLKKFEGKLRLPK